MLVDPLVLIFGKSLTGKTARMLHELREEPRVVLVDAKCSQLAALPAWRHLWPEYNAGLEKWTTTDLTRFFAAALDQPFRSVVHFKTYHRENLELLCYLVERVKCLVLAVDELGLFIPPRQALLPNTTSVLISGTHKGVRVMGTAQRPSLVHATAKANASRMLFYRITEQNDLDDTRTYLPQDLHGQLETLPNYACIDWADGRDPYRDETLVGKLAGLLPGDRL